MIKTPCNSVKRLSPLILLALAACGGGGGGGSDNSNIPQQELSFVELARMSEERQTRVENKYPAPSNDLRDILPTTNMPATGTATYTGEATIYLNDGLTATIDGETDDDIPQLISQGTLKADFAKKTVSGTLDDFVAAPGHRTTGAKASYNGTIVGNTTSGSWEGHANFDGVDHSFTDVKGIGDFVGGNGAGLDIDSGGVTSRGEYIAVEGFFEKTGK